MSLYLKNALLLSNHGPSPLRSGGGDTLPLVSPTGMLCPKDYLGFSISRRWL